MLGGGWEMCFSTEAGREFFYNHESQCSSWVLPGDIPAPAAAQRLAAMRSHRPHASPAVDASALMVGLWQVCFDRQYGVHYFVHSRTCDSVWELPAGHAAPSQRVLDAAQRRAFE
jgi:hypothetical protein